MIDCEDSESLDIIWLSNQIPFSTRYNDVYFSKLDGYKESEYIFIKGNYLPQRIKQSRDLCIGELGFGTGLNFLITANIWQTYSLQDAKLHYIAIEKFPLKPQQCTKALLRWQHLLPHYYELIEQLPEEYADSKYELYLTNNITLTLLVGDVSKQFKRWPQLVDAWYLDGFTPNSNPEMWEKTVLQSISINTVRNGTFATFYGVWTG